MLKRFLVKATSQNDHYMINMTGQRPKIGGNWPLTSPYLQRWITNIYMYNTYNIMLQSFKSFQIHIFLFFLVLQYPFLS